MLTRREMMAAGVAVIAAGAIGDGAWADETRATGSAEEADRALKLKISDRFRSQEWAYAGQVWSEEKKQLTFFEDELVYVVVENDSYDTHFVSVTTGAETGVAIPPGRKASFYVHVRTLAGFAVESRPRTLVQKLGHNDAFAIHAKVRATYGAHAPV